MWRALSTVAARAGAKANTHAAATRAASAIARPAFRSSVPALALSRTLVRSFSKSSSPPPPPPPQAAASASSSSDPFSADSSLWQLDGGASWSTAADGSTSLDAAESFGQVVGVSKGIVSVDGVATAHVGACIQFFATEDPTVVAAWGLVVSIHRDFAKALILGGSDESVSVGMNALHTRGHVPALDIKPGHTYALAGQVIDALGRKLDPQTLAPYANVLPPPIVLSPQEAENPTSAEPSTSNEVKPLPLLTQSAPSLASRTTTHSFLPTGLLHLDAFHPLAEGLRVGVMGPKRAGKSALAAGIIGSLAAQQRQYEAEIAAASSADASSPAFTSVLPPPLPAPLHFIYVCVGQTRFDVRAVLDRLSRNGSLSRTTVIVAAQDEPLGMQYLAPFLGATLSDFYRSRGESSFVVYDDLAAHGHILTQINAAYGYPILPSQYVHARLLERIGPLLPADAKAVGAGATVSSTSLVLVETARSDRDVAVNLNLGSAVDHALWLDASLASKGLFPALACNSILGRPAAKYRPHVLRALSDVVCQSVLASNHRANTAAWAAQFGLRDELTSGDSGAATLEEDDALVQFKDKCQLMLTQKGAPAGGDDTNFTPGASNGNGPLTLAEQFVLLFALQKDGALLASVSLVNVWRYRAALLALLHGQAKDANQTPQMARAPQLYTELQRALRLRVASTGNSTAEETLSTSADGPHTASANDAATADTIAQLQRQLDRLLDDFNEAFKRQYER